MQSFDDFAQDAVVGVPVQDAARGTSIDLPDAPSASAKWASAEVKRLFVVVMGLSFLMTIHSALVAVVGISGLLAGILGLGMASMRLYERCQMDSLDATVTLVSGGKRGRVVGQGLGLAVGSAPLRCLTVAKLLHFVPHCGAHFQVRMLAWICIGLDGFTALLFSMFVHIILTSSEFEDDGYSLDFQVERSLAWGEESVRMAAAAAAAGARGRRER